MEIYAMEIKNFLSKYWLFIAFTINASLDYLHIPMFLLFGKFYQVITLGLQPLVFIVSLILFPYLKSNFKKWQKTIIIIAIILTSFFVKSQANIPSNISKCADGKIEIQVITFTGAGYRYYLGEDQISSKK